MSGQKKTQEDSPPVSYNKPELKDLGPLKDLTRGGGSGTGDGMGGYS